MGLMETPSPNGWTVGALKSYVDQRFLDSDKAVQLALMAAKEAVAKAEAAADKRFDDLRTENDKRFDTLSEEADRRADDQMKAIGEIQRSISGDHGKEDGRDSSHSTFTGNLYALGAVGGFATAIITLILTHH